MGGEHSADDEAPEFEQFEEEMAEEADDLRDALADGFGEALDD